jgi:hypothetical protein
VTGVSERPALAAGGVSADEARAAVGALVAELQAGWDTRDADLTNRHFATDLLWGSPFGAVLQGYEPLHRIHVRLKQQGRGGPGGAPVPPCPPASDGSGTFSEMALYVLVRRDGQWWLAAGQNTLVLPPPG